MQASNEFQSNMGSSKGSGLMALAYRAFGFYRVKGPHQEIVVAAAHTLYAPLQSFLNESRAFVLRSRSRKEAAQGARGKKKAGGPLDLHGAGRFRDTRNFTSTRCVAPVQGRKTCLCLDPLQNEGFDVEGISALSILGID